MSALLERVPVDDVPLVHAAGLGRLDVVGPQRLEHVDPHHADEHAADHQAERHAGKDQVLEGVRRRTAQFRWMIASSR